MTTQSCTVATQQLIAGLAAFLDEEMWVYMPTVIRPKEIPRPQFGRDDEYYWIVRATSNYLIQEAHQYDFVVGVALVTAFGIEVSVFTSQFELALQCNSVDVGIGYIFYATKTVDENRRNMWIVKMSHALSNSSIDSSSMEQGGHI